MNSKPIIVLFEENEMNIAALYSLYAQKIPTKKSFWERLSNEEIGHAASIGHEKRYPSEITENKFSRGIINHVMSFVLDETKKVQQGEVTHHSALLAALRIEQSMLEKKCFDIFTPTNTTLKTMFCKLNKETEQHTQRLLAELKRNKFPLK